MLAIKLRVRIIKSWYFIWDSKEWQVYYSNIRPAKRSIIRIFNHNLYFAILWLCLLRFFCRISLYQPALKCLCVANVHVVFPIKFYVNIFNFCFRRTSDVSKHLTGREGRVGQGRHIGLCSCREVINKLLLIE